MKYPGRNDAFVPSNEPAVQIVFRRVVLPDGRLVVQEVRIDPSGEETLLGQSPGEFDVWVGADGKPQPILVCRYVALPTGFNGPLDDTLTTLEPPDAIQGHPDAAEGQEQAP